MFAQFKKAVQHQFSGMSKHELFRTAAPKDAMWEAYLAAFPEGTNPIYRKSSEHDCSCCRSFIRAAGDMVAIIDGKLVSIWDVNIGGTYQIVADALSALVKSHKIEDFFVHEEKTVGTDKSFEQAVSGVVTYDHFFLTLPAAVVKKKAEIGPLLSNLRVTHDVMLRGLTELTEAAVDTVLELVAQNSLYRGEEYKFAVSEFKKLQQKFAKLTSEVEKDLFCWAHVKSVPVPVSRIRNNAIGVLLIDLSEEVSIEDAVNKFEKSIMAPANYKRPTALVTKAMIDNAKKEVEALGLTPSLSRRHAVLSDISINNVLFANRDAKKVMSGGVFDDLAASAPQKSKNLDKLEEIGIEAFLSNVVPTAKSIEVLLENRHSGNLVSLVAPEDFSAPMLFKWDNPFSWSYNGEVADSMKERVKAAGGKVDGVLRFSIMWSGEDKDNSDLDAHCQEPTGHIYFGTRRVASGGNLDVDITGPVAQCKGNPAVENITWPNLKTMKDGRYVMYVNQFSARNSQGFSAEIEFGGQIFRYEYPKAVKGNVQIAEVTLKGGEFTIKHLLSSTASSKEVWGIPTQVFHKVNALMLSPNHWDEQAVGNKHYFFMLDGCANDATARGFYNEFLREDLSKHRKVMEMVGSKLKLAEATEQLSGLGFSSTQRNSVTVKVTGTFTRMLKVVF